MDVVVGLIKNSEGHILVARRGLNQPFPNKLEFPGGKIDPMEPHFSALVRELKEELDIEVKDAHFAFDLPFQYEKIQGSLKVWVVDEYEREPYGAEGQEVFWLPINKILESEFLHANSVIIDYLRSENNI